MKISDVLNLIITGIPSIPKENVKVEEILNGVLNLIITGIPSIQLTYVNLLAKFFSFKPYYNWNTFNTLSNQRDTKEIIQRFKPYYNWNTFNTLDLNKNIDFMVDWFTF